MVTCPLTYVVQHATDLKFACVADSAGACEMVWNNDKIISIHYNQCISDFFILKLIITDILDL